MKPLLVITLVLTACVPRPRPPRPAPADGPSFTVRVVGDGPPMVLIPGLACPGEVWDHAVARWSPHHSLHIVSIAGFAGQPPIAAPLLPTVHRELLRYLETARLERPVIIGHSLGGFLAWWLAAAAPDRVGAVVAVEGVPFVADLFSPGATVEKARPSAEAMRNMLAGLSPEEFAVQNRRQLATMITDPKEVDRIAALGGRSDPASVGQAIFEMMTTDLRAEVAAVRAPALLIVGDTGGAAAARALGERQLARVRDHRIIVLEHARHFAMLDAPEPFFAAVDRFLAEAQVAAAR
jgi:pimeloyl-ACP methyl ester carboxylesterase